MASSRVKLTLLLSMLICFNAISHTHYNAKDERIFAVFSSTMCDYIVVLCFCNLMGYRSHQGTSQNTLYESTDKSYNTFFYGRLSQVGKQVGGLN